MAEKSRNKKGEYCDKCCTYSGNLVEHTRDKQPDNARYSCDLCQYVGYNLRAMERHKETKHNVGFPCFGYSCKFIASSSAELKKHNIEQHRYKQRKELEHRCDQCGMTFRTRLFLGNHVAWHFNYKNFSMDNKNKALAYREGMDSTQTEQHTVGIYIFQNTPP